MADNDAKEQEATVKKARQWLEEQPGWLLILDNADNVELAKDLVPGNRQGHVLITTRAHALGGIANRFDIPDMPAEDGEALLLR